MANGIEDTDAEERADAEDGAGSRRKKRAEAEERKGLNAEEHGGRVEEDGYEVLL